MGHERRFEPTIAGKTVYPITGDQLGINIGRMIPAKLGNIQMRTRGDSFPGARRG